MISRSVLFKNIVKIKFTKSNIFPSILIKKTLDETNHDMLFTISLGTFRKLTKYLG